MPQGTLTEPERSQILEMIPGAAQVFDQSLRFQERGDTLAGLFEAAQSDEEISALEQVQTHLEIEKFGRPLPDIENREAVHDYVLGRARDLDPGAISPRPTSRSSRTCAGRRISG